MNQNQAEEFLAKIIESERELAAELISQVSDKTDLTEEQFPQEAAEGVARGLMAWIRQQLISADFDEIELSGVIDGKRIRSAFFIQVDT